MTDEFAVRQERNYLYVENERLRAVNADYALLLRALILKVARWETGEVCCGGMRYSTDLDEHGCPKLNAHIRAALASAAAGLPSRSEAKAGAA